MSYFSSMNSSVLLIAGAGAAGMSAALSAAARGQPVFLLDVSSRCGGTVSHALIHTLGGFHDSEGELVNAGLPSVLLDRLQAASSQTRMRQIGKTWVLNVDPLLYEQTTQRWLEESGLIKFLPNSSIINQCIQSFGSECHIRAVTLQTPNGILEQEVSAVIDATGQAAVVNQFAAQSVTETTALAGFIVQLRGVEAGTLRFPKGVALLRRIRKAVAEGKLAPECSTLWLDSGVFPDEVYVKFNLLATGWNKMHMHEVAQSLVKFLQTQDGFAQAYISQYGDIGIRNGGQVKGRYCLTEDDIKQSRQFEDAACYGCWPIEHWHVSKGIELEYFPAGHRYSIPLRSLQVAGFDNLWVAGKCLSAEPRVQASARVVGTCWAMGEAVGAYLAEGVGQCH